MAGKYPHELSGGQQRARGHRHGADHLTAIHHRGRTHHRTRLHHATPDRGPADLAGGRRRCLHAVHHPRFLRTRACHHPATCWTPAASSNPDPPPTCSPRRPHHKPSAWSPPPKPSPSTPPRRIRMSNSSVPLLFRRPLHHQILRPAHRTPPSPFRRLRRRPRRRMSGRDRRLRIRQIHADPHYAELGIRGLRQRGIREPIHCRRPKIAGIRGPAPRIGTGVPGPVLLARPTLASRQISG